MSSSFRKDLEFGNRIEIAWMNFMGDKTLKTYEQSKGKEPGWDIVELSNKVYFEVKWDTKSSAAWSSYGTRRDPTGNLFIEYVNPSADKDSGIRASISKYWVYVVKYAPNTVVDENSFGEYKAHAHLFNRENLLKFCESSSLNTRDTKRDVGKGMPVNARGWILPWDIVNQSKKDSGWLAVYDISDYLSLPILTQ